VLCSCGTDDGSGTLDFSDFVLVMGEKSREADIETHFKDTFRVFSKDEDGKIHDLRTLNRSSGEVVKDSSQGRDKGLQQGRER
jgi:Ca2+-binding EF-hand superfamily protein